MNEEFLTAMMKLQGESRRVLTSVLVALRVDDPELSSELATKIRIHIEEIRDARSSYARSRA